MSSRKVEMVLELIDRATRPVQRILRLQERLGRTTKKANESASRSLRLAERAGRAYGRTTERLGRAQSALRGRVNAANDAIGRQAGRLRTNAALMRKGLVGTGRAAVLAGGMLAAYSGTATAAAASFLGPARQFENFQVQLTSLEGSSDRARQAMTWIEGFATSTPLQLEQVVEAYQQMKTFGMDPTNGSLLALVDTMAASGKGAEHLSGLTLALGKSWTKGKLQGEEIMMLMERGVPVWDMLAAKTGKNVQQLQEMASAGKLGRAEIQLLIDAMATKNAGASAAMSRTWDGIISNILDNWTAFQRMVMGSGVFEYMKGKLGDVLAVINEMRANGEMQQWADMVARYMLNGLKVMWNFGQGIINLWQFIYPNVAAAADALGGWNRLALALVAIPFRGVILNAAGAAFYFARGALGASLALSRIGFAGAMRGALRLGLAFLGLLNPMNFVRGSFALLRAAMIASGIGALVLAIAAGGAWIYNNWSGLKAMFTGLGEGIRAAMGPAGPIFDAVVDSVSNLIDWVGRLVAPIDASQATWHEWGVNVGVAIGDAITFITGLPARTVAALANGWSAVAAWMGDMWSGLTEHSSAAWDGLKFLLANYTPAGLIYTRWDGIATWASGLWSGLIEHAAQAWDGLKRLLANYTPAGLVYTHWNGLKNWVTGLWDGLIHSADLAWEGLKILLANYTAPGLIYSNWDGIVGYFTELWAQVKQIFTDAWAVIESTVIAPMRGAVGFMTDNKLTRGIGSARRGISDLFGGDDVQERARGGSFNPGWLLTGEKGPELEYRSRAGYIAHNDALTKMVGMSERVRRNVANAKHAPRTMMRGAAVAAGVAASSAAMPVAAAPGGISIERIAASTPAAGDTQISAPISINITGNADTAQIDELKRTLDDFAKELECRFDAKQRAATRRSHL